jgi:hypothetical protein
VKKQKATAGGKSDIVMTPDSLAHAVVRHFRPQISGRVLEPCSGSGAFLRAFERLDLSNVTSLELSKGQDFFGFTEPVDWIITNPPWSKARMFALHAYSLSHDIVWLINVGHFLGFKARLRDMQQAVFGVKEVALCATPGPATGWPQSGFQLGALHFQKAWQGPITLSTLDEN